MLFRKNNLSIGISLVILVSIGVFGILNGITQLSGYPFKVRTIALIAICSNMLIIRQFRRNRAGESIRGAVITIVVLSILWIVWFGQEIYEELQNT